MHDLLHSILNAYDRDLEAIHRSGDWWDFELFLDYWLAGLFVVVEGFNKLKLRDARVQGLFKANIRHLKALRHETYHFVVANGDDAREIIRELNWAEELHAAIGDYIHACLRKGIAQEFLVWRHEQGKSRYKGRYKSLPRRSKKLK